MYIKTSRKIIQSFTIILSLLASTPSIAWHGHHGGNWSEGPRVYPNYEYHRPHRGGLFFGGGWGGPNVVINVPSPSFYPECHRVEVCNRYRECWLETHCD